MRLPFLGKATVVEGRTSLGLVLKTALPCKAESSGEEASLGAGAIAGFVNGRCRV